MQISVLKELRQNYPIAKNPIENSPANERPSPSQGLNQVEKKIETDTKKE